jgi:broad specificity phosphatase PhoE
MFGGVHRTVPDLIGSDGGERKLVTVQREMNAFIGREADPKGVLVLVGHHGTINALTTRMLDAGDALIIRPQMTGDHRILAHVPAARWEEITRDLDRQRFEPER